MAIGSSFIFILLALLLYLHFLINKANRPNTLSNVKKKMLLILIIRSYRNIFAMMQAERDVFILPSNGPNIKIFWMLRLFFLFFNVKWKSVKIWTLWVGLNEMGSSLTPSKTYASQSAKMQWMFFLHNFLCFFLMHCTVIQKGKWAMLEHFFFCQCYFNITIIMFSWDNKDNFLIMRD